jgi:site-specific recombinase XerD
LWEGSNPSAEAFLEHPEHADLISRVLSIPQKRFDRVIVEFLTKEEVEAILAVPDRDTWIGRRDHALLTVAVQTGLRVAELTGLLREDVVLTTGPHVRCRGKGRKQRSTPLTASTVTALREWLKIHDAQPRSPLFPSRQSTPLSTDAVEWLVRKYATAAASRCPSLATRRITPHVLRHSTAMFLREAGVDISVIALWLGHESIASTQIYMHADLALKQRALGRTTPPEVTPNRYRPSDSLFAYLDAL